MRIGIRCDAGGEYGLGHISRMTSLLKALKLQDPDTEITFYSKTPALWMSQHCPVNCDIAKFGEDEPEARLIRWIYENESEDVLIIDRKEYYDPSLLRQAKRHMKVVLIDMPWARPAECNLLVIPNIHQPPDVIDQLEGLFGEENFLYGREYIIVRDEVTQTQVVPYKRREPCIGFFAGGSDPNNWLQLMYNMSESLNLPNVQRVFCVGDQSRSLTLRPGDRSSWIASFNYETLSRASLAVSLFGVTVYEAMYLRTPVITTGHNKQNEVGSQYLVLASEGSTYHIPPIDNMMREDFCGYIERIWNDLVFRKDMHNKSAFIVGADGASNIAERILCLDP